MTADQPQPAHQQKQRHQEHHRRKHIAQQDREEQEIAPRKAEPRKRIGGRHRHGDAQNGRGNRHIQAVPEIPQEILPHRIGRIQQLAVIGQCRFGGPPLRRILHRRELRFDRGQDHPDHRHHGKDQQERQKESPRPPPPVNRLARFRTRRKDRGIGHPARASSPRVSALT